MLEQVKEIDAFAPWPAYSILGAQGPLGVVYCVSFLCQNWALSANAAPASQRYFLSDQLR